MSGHKHPPHYHAFLLRCWQERSERNEQLDEWRFSLEDPRTGARHGFTTLNAVFSAVETALASNDEPRESSDQSSSNNLEGGV